MSGIEQVFILGAPRSGTTFLSSLLENTRFGVPVETHFITKYYKILDRYGDLSNAGSFRRLMEDILAERPVQQWRLQLDIDEFYHSLDGDYRYANIVNRLVLRREAMSGYQAWGDKTPHYLGDVDILFTLFPDAKFVYIVRDGRDVALSLLQKNWGPNNVMRCAEYWARLNDKAETIDRIKARGNLWELSYEGLIEETESYIDRVYGFLDETIDKSTKNRLVQSVKGSNYNKWKTQMSPEQIRTFESVAGDTLIRFGYEIQTDCKPLPAWKAMLYRMHDQYRRVLFLFEINVIDGIKIRFFGKEPFNE
ncbi:sulfotransferase family protein [Saccharospirillum salsuginis]|uniref:Sulfotransferase n=1 Tax=Saccharospirillum salsuginis TaxID=418750 RepID=A0A918K5U0_9GAMM|nr:sulfotransferase [Saccharospirillum salsuginis]GGX49620.1 sulfotransferase [Saccharospirillum salsuginis]